MDQFVDYTGYDNCEFESWKVYIYYEGAFQVSLDRVDHWCFLTNKQFV